MNGAGEDGGRGAGSATRARILALRTAGLSLAGIAARLNRDGLRAALGGRWYAGTVRRCLPPEFHANPLRSSHARTHATSIAARIDADRARLP
ncbi:MAG: recombinase family protein [Pseudomonadota bacterium]